jgi:hypothetical protein
MTRWVKGSFLRVLCLCVLGGFVQLGAAEPLAPQATARPAGLTPEEIVKSTIVKLDMSAFPRDPGPDYKVQGQVFHVSLKGSDAGQGEE